MRHPAWLSWLIGPGGHFRFQNIMSEYIFDVQQLHLYAW